jgi:putative thioredoxin
MSDSAWIVDVTEENIESAVVEPCQDTPVVVDFWAPWCAPCRMLGPVLEKLTNEKKGRVILAKVNTEEAPQLAKYFRVSSIPAVKVFYQGQIVTQFEGVQPEEALRELFDQMAPEADPALTQAQATETAAPANAEQKYRAVLEKQPDHSEARLGLARALLAQGRFDEVEPVLEPLEVSGDVGAEADRIKAQLYFERACQDVPPEAELARAVGGNPKDAAARLSLGKRLALRGEYEMALAMLYAAAELDAKLAAGAAKEAMVKTFYALGTNHALANEYRAKLARLLY